MRAQPSGAARRCYESGRSVLARLRDFRRNEGCFEHAAERADDGDADGSAPPTEAAADARAALGGLTKRQLRLEAQRRA